MAWSGLDAMELEETKIREESLRKERATARAKGMSRGDAGRLVGSAGVRNEDDVPSKREGRTGNRGSGAGEDVGGFDRGDLSRMDDARNQEKVDAAMEELRGSEVAVATMMGFYKEMVEAERGRADAEAQARSLQVWLGASEGAARRLEAKVELLRGEATTASQAAVERLAGADNINMVLVMRVMELEGLLSSERDRADEAEKLSLVQRQQQEALGAA